MRNHRNTTAYVLTYFTVFALAIVVGCRSMDSGPSDTILAVERAVKDNREDMFLSHLSQATVRMLDGVDSPKGTVDASTFMAILADSVPWTVRQVDVVDTTAQVKIEMPGGEVSTVTVITEDGEWRLDLQEELGEWKMIFEHTIETMREMEKTTPFLGAEGPSTTPPEAER